MSAEILRKITLKTAGLDKTAIQAALGNNKTIDLMKIVGVTTSATPGQSDLGEFVKFNGQFRAINMVTGETFESTVAILPNFISQQLAGALTQSEEVEFGLQIGAKKSNSVTGYEYTVKPLVEPVVSDKMGALLAAAGMTDNVKKLKAA